MNQSKKIKKRLIAAGYQILNSKFFSRFLDSYRLIWEFAAMRKFTAMEAVLYGVSNEKDFWSSGKEIAFKLRKFVDRDSIVLDVGCGMGRVEKHLAPYCKKIFAIDISSRMIKLAKEHVKTKNVHFIKNNGRDLQVFKDNQFDFIFSILTLQHMEKEDAYIYLKEMHRTLKPKGKIYLQFPNFLSREGFKVFVDYAESGSRHAARVRAYTVPEVKKILTSIGFNIVEISANHDIHVLGEKKSP